MEKKGDILVRIKNRSALVEAPKHSKLVVVK